MLKQKIYFNQKIYYKEKREEELSQFLEETTFFFVFD